MRDVIFREYDIRGKVGTDLVVDEVYDLVRAIAAYWVEKKATVKTVAVGMDGRTHSPQIKQELCRALVDSGFDVLFLGVCTSPALYFALYTQPIDAGLMITASHNGKEYNGIKICLGRDAVWGAQIQVIRTMYREKRCIIPAHRGTIRDYPIVPRYVAWLADRFAMLKKNPLSVIIDCGNGAAGSVMPALCAAMEWPNVQLLYPEIDGTYPHHEADPTIAENMNDVKNILATMNFSLGIGLDGDCDRMVPMTKDGYLVPGDRLLAVFAQPMLARFPGASVVFDAKSSSGLIELLTAWGANPIMSASGHAIIKQMMKKNDAQLGGELSCHFFFKDGYFGYDDGIYAALRLMEILVQTGKTLPELLAHFPAKWSSRELRVPCPDATKLRIVEDVKKILMQRANVTTITIDGIRASMPYGWFIIRASNTQPALSIRGEADTRDTLKRVLADVSMLLGPYLSRTALDEIEHERENA